MAEIDRGGEKQKTPKKLGFWPRTVAKLVLAASATAVGLSGGIKSVNQEGDRNGQNIPTPIPEAHKQPEPTGAPQVILTSGPTTSTKTPSPFETAIPFPSGFEQVKTLIENAQGSQEEKTQATQLVENLEKVSGVLNQFKTAYESQIEPGGTPTLLALTVESLDHLDPSSLYPGLTPEESRIEWAKDNIFYLKDQKELKNGLQEFSKDLKLPKIIDKLNNLGINLRMDQYLQVDSQKGHSSYQIEMEPGVEVSPEEMEKIKETLDKMPIPGNVIVRLSTIAINMKKYNAPVSIVTYGNPNSPAIMSIVTEYDVIQGVRLEVGHLLQVSADPYKNILYFSPEEFVRLQIKELQALDPQRMATLLAPSGPEDYKDQSASEIMRNAQDFISEQFSVMIEKAVDNPDSSGNEYLRDFRTFFDN